MENLLAQVIFAITSYLFIIILLVRSSRLKKEVYYLRNQNLYRVEDIKNSKYKFEERYYDLKNHNDRLNAIIDTELSSKNELNIISKELIRLINESDTEKNNPKYNRDLIDSDIKENNGLTDLQLLILKTNKDDYYKQKSYAIRRINRRNKK